MEIIFFISRNLNLNINQLMFNKETSEQVIPIGYKDFTIAARNIEYSNAQNITIRSLALKPANGEIRDVILTPGASLQRKKTTVVLKNRSYCF